MILERPWIAGWATDKAYPVTFMCDQLGVVRQGYYRWLAEGPMPLSLGRIRGPGRMFGWRHE